MKREAFYMTAADLAARGLGSLPPQFDSSKHLIYSSPATLAFNSPGAEGFGVKRAGLAIPGSVMLIVSPGCCGRNTALVSRMPEYENRFFYLNLEEKDVVTGAHLRLIPDAVCEVIDFLGEKPSVFMICITCVDALLGTDMERVCRKAEIQTGVPVRPCYMYALTREGSRPPMVHVRQSLYSLLQKRKRSAKNVNILGFFSPLQDECELFSILKEAGAESIRQISTCGSYDEFLKMAEAGYSLLLNPECRFAGADMTENLGIPYVELARLYDAERNLRQYQSLAKALGTDLDVSRYYEETAAARDDFVKGHKDLRLCIGECQNGDPFEMALALTLAGLDVDEIYGTVTQENFVWIKMLARVSPLTRVYSNLEPTMLYYDGASADVDFAIGKDACYYHQDIPGINWNSDIQPFGFSGIVSLFQAMEAALDSEKMDAGEITCGGGAA